MNFKEKILEEISKMNKDDRMTYYVGLDITKNIITILFRKCFDLIGLNESVLGKIRIVEIMDFVSIDDDTLDDISEFDSVVILNGLYKYG